MSSIETQELSGTLNNTNSLRGTLNGDNNLQGTLSNARNSGSGGSGNTLIIELPQSLIADFWTEDGLFVSAQSTGDDLVFYNNIKAVEDSDKLSESNIIFMYKSTFGGLVVNAPISIQKDSYGIEAFGIIGRNAIDRTKLNVIRIETGAEYDVPGYFASGMEYPFN